MSTSEGHLQQLLVFHNVLPGNVNLAKILRIFLVIHMSHLDHPLLHNIDILFLQSFNCPPVGGNFCAILQHPCSLMLWKNILDAINKKDKKTFRRKDPVHTVKIFSALAAITPRSETSRPFLLIKIRSFPKEDVDLLILDIVYLWIISYLKTFS